MAGILEPAFDLFQGIQTTRSWHGNVENRKVRDLRAKDLEGLGAVAGEHYPVAFLFERYQAVFANVLVVVGKRIVFTNTPVLLGRQPASRSGLAEGATAMPIATTRRPRMEVSAPPGDETSRGADFAGMRQPPLSAS